MRPNTGRPAGVRPSVQPKRLSASRQRRPTLVTPHSLVRAARPWKISGHPCPLAEKREPPLHTGMLSAQHLRKLRCFPLNRQARAFPSARCLEDQICLLPGSRQPCPRTDEYPPYRRRNARPKTEQRARPPVAPSNSSTILKHGLRMDETAGKTSPRQQAPAGIERPEVLCQPMVMASTAGHRQFVVRVEYR